MRNKRQIHPLANLVGEHRGIEIFADKADSIGVKFELNGVEHRATDLADAYIMIDEMVRDRADDSKRNKVGDDEGKVTKTKEEVIAQLKKWQAEGLGLAIATYSWYLDKMGEPSIDLNTADVIGEAYSGWIDALTVARAVKRGYYNPNDDYVQLVIDKNIDAPLLSWSYEHAHNVMFQDNDFIEWATKDDNLEPGTEYNTVAEMLKRDGPGYGI